VSNEANEQLVSCVTPEAGANEAEANEDGATNARPATNVMAAS
jgi:hypothetical protein